MIETSAHHKWTTNDELTFLSSLGSHRRDSSGDQRTALRQYRDTMHKRSVWGEVNKAAVREWMRGSASKLRCAGKGERR